MTFGYDEHSFLVDTAEKRTHLQQNGEQRYLEAHPFQHGLSTCSRGNLPEVIGFLPEGKELDDQELALQSSSSTDLVEDKSFLESLHAHDQSSFVCVICEEEVAVSGGELSDHSLHPFQQPQQLSSQDEQLHNSNPRSTLQRSEELQEAKGTASKEKVRHVLSAACVCDLPDSAWRDPALLFRGQLPSQLSGQKNPGKRVTNNLAASQHKMLEESQVDTRAETSTALHIVVSVGSPASFGGASLGASSMELWLPSPLSASELASESLKETEEAPAETNLLQLPAPSLTLTSLQLHSVVASLSSRQKSLQQRELDRTASTAEDEHTADSACGNLCFSPSRARQSFQLTRAQLCRQPTAEESLQQKELAAAYAF